MITYSMLIEKAQHMNSILLSSNGDSSNLLIPCKKFKTYLSAPPETVRTPASSAPWSSSVSLDSVTYTKLIQLSSKSGSPALGKLAHAHMIKTSFKPCLFLLNNLLNMYCKCGEVGLARHLFDKMPKRNIVSFNSLISGYTKMGLHDQVMSVFAEARMAALKLDKFTYAGALGVCGEVGNLELGKLIHGLVIVAGLAKQTFLTNLLISMYCKCGHLDQAWHLFESSRELDQISWNSLIAGNVRISANEEVLRLLARMHRRGLSLSTYTMGSVLKACCSYFDDDWMKYGMMVHGCAVKLGMDSAVVVGTALLDMYAKNWNLKDAIKVFELMPGQNVVMYNAMIAGFLQKETVNDEAAKRAFTLFLEMQWHGMKPSRFTFSSILKACNAVEAFEYGKQIHAQICKNNFQSDEFIGSALIELYSSLGLIEDCLKCFNSTPMLDLASWTSMIASHVENGQFEIAFALFHELLASGRKPDEFLISSMLGACADLAAARSGEQVQGYSIKYGVGNFTIVQNSQICMYAKSGNIDSANKTFEEVENPDVVTWSVIISGNAQHGFAKDAVNLFDSMRIYGVEPNHITFLAVLTACSHGGLVEEGLRSFESMKKPGMVANVKHSACVVDLLGRAGRLTDAENFILSSGFEDNPVMWRALLSACRVYKDMVTAKRVAERVIELEPEAASSYLLLYNIYTDAGIEPPAMKVRELMTDRGVKKEPGLSWIEVGNKVHSFVVGDVSHPMSQEIYAKLQEMLEKINKLDHKDNTVLPSQGQINGEPP